MADLESDVPIPPPTASDPEDVSWALSTAEAMWVRGDIAEAVKWLRRGAEAASEAEADVRALELAKAAANLASRVPRRSSPAASASTPQGSSAAALLEATPQAAMTSGISPTPLRRHGSSLPPQHGATPPRGVPSTRSGPAPSSHHPASAPSTSRTGAPLPAAFRSSPPASALPPPLSPQRPKSVPVPVSALESGRFAAQEVADDRRPSARVRLATQPDANEAAAGQPDGDFDDQTGKGAEPPTSTPTSAGEAEEPWAPSPPSSQPPRRASMTTESTAQMPALTELNAIEVLRGRRPLKALASSASDWDAVPTKTLSGADLGELPPLRPQVAVAPGGPAEAQSEPPDAAPLPPPSVRPDERRVPLATSQAVRVVLWKDANGVHVAPHGTLVSAITVDVMVVALDPSADIRAWLDPTHRKSSQ